MKSKSTVSNAATPLRRRAETRLRTQAEMRSPGPGGTQSTAETRRLLHELQVHQVELEMQNEELRDARNEIEAELEKYSELYNFAPVGYLTLDPTGGIREANLAAASLLGIPRAPLVKLRLGFLVVPAERPIFQAFLQQVMAGPDRKECDLQLLVKDKAPVAVRMRGNRTASGDACRMALSDITQHKRAETITAQLAAIVTSSTDAIVSKDLNGVVTSWNAGAEKIFGYAASEMVGCPISRLIPADRRSEETEIMNRIRQGKSVEHIETVRVTKAGVRLDLSVTISPISHGGGKIAGASTVARDITDQRVAADKVRVSEIRYRRLFEAAHDGVLILDPATRKITDANPFMTRLLGYPRNQLVGKELFEIGLLKDEAASQEMFRKLQRKHEVRYEDLPLKSQTGRHQEVEVVANLYQENGHAVIQCNIRDITARKETEEALRSSEERYRTLFNSIDEGFCVIELLYDKQRRPVDFRYLEINPSFEAQSGMHGAQGKRILEFSQTVEMRWLELYDKVIRTGKPVRFSNEMKGLDRWFDVYAFQLGGRKSRKLAVLFTNITERKRAEAALHDAQASLAVYAGKLEMRVAERTAALTTTNRRLKNSVHTIRKAREEYRRLLLESDLTQKKVRQMARQILTVQEEERKEISRELHDVVVQTLVGINVELAALNQAVPANAVALKGKIAHTQRQVENSVTAVHQFARELRPAVLDDLGLIPALHSFCRALAESKKLRIHLTAFAEVEALGGDERTVLFRVAQEALTNVARHAHATHVRIALSRAPGKIHMEIGDNGRSFHVGKVLHAQNPKRLGLIGMKERIEMIGGTLGIESAPGSGTTVRVEVPFNPEKSSS